MYGFSTTMLSLASSFLDDDAVTGVPLSGWTKPKGFLEARKPAVSMVNNLRGKNRKEVQVMYDRAGAELAALYLASKELIASVGVGEGWTGVAEMENIDELKDTLRLKIAEERAVFKQKNKAVYDGIDLASKQGRRQPQNTLSVDWITEKHALAGRVEGLAALVARVNGLVGKEQTFSEAAHFENLAPKHVHGHPDEYHLAAAFRCLRRSKYQAVEVLLRTLDDTPVGTRSEGQARFLHTAEDIEMKKTAVSELSQSLFRNKPKRRDLQLADKNDLQKVIPLAAHRG